MSKNVRKVVVTGGAGQIAYSLLFKIANGDLFGRDQAVSLRILDVPGSTEALKGVEMELQDCAFPLLEEIIVGSEAEAVFEGGEYAFLVGAKPRGAGMERSDLLKDNGKIFVQQGQALDRVAEKNVKVLVVGNPCNTNCLIAMHHAASIPRKNFQAMMRLDENRARAQIALKAGCGISDVSCMTIWGNHSSTQVPDYIHAKVRGRPVLELIKDAAWFDREFVPTVQKRGSAIIAARGKSSAASAASAAVDAMRSLAVETSKGDWFSSAVASDGNPYGISEGLVFSFPCRSSGKGDWNIVPGLAIDEMLALKLKATEKELIEERDLVRELL